MSRKAELNDVFSICSEDTLSPKVTHLAYLAARLVRRDCERAAENFGRAREAGASEAELRCAACYAACTVGPSVEDDYARVSGTKRAFAGKVERALDEKTTHLVGLTACLTAGCDCAAGHIVQARNAGASREEIARAACISACVGGRVNHWRFVDAAECAQGQKECVC